MNQPESSLEIGMREIKETASRLDKNMQKFKNKDDQPIQTGFGSSFKPHATQQNTKNMQALPFGNYSESEVNNF
jgi:hypothetical protein